MYVVAVHGIEDRERFWGAVQSTPVPEGFTLHSVLPDANGSRAVCLWESDSLEAVRDLVEGTVGGFSSNQYFEVEPSRAVGLPG